VPSLDVHAFVIANLPPPPARVLEVGAGEGDLARDLEHRGYDVVAIDPNSEANGVVPVALAELDAEPGSFDAAVAIVSLHHVEPLDESIRRLAEVTCAGATLLVDEFDVERFDERAATWLVARWRELGREHEHEAADLVAELRDELHSLAALQDALAPAFDLSTPVRGSYLYRWYLNDGLRPAEDELIIAGDLPAVGARFSGVRRSD
jgi:ubiquinone/menaquinone biosynthesis C-methylase UbiE